MHNVKNLCGGLAVGIVLALSACGRAGARSDEVCPVAGDQAVTAALRSIRRQYQLPAIAGAIVTSKGVQ